MMFLDRIKSFVLPKLPRSTIARSVSVLASGAVVGQLLLVLMSPVLTRLYTPEDFGVLAIYIALLSLFGVVASLRYELAVPLPQQDEDAANLVALCFVLIGVMVILSSITVFSAGPQLTALLGVPGLTPHLWLLPIGIFLVSIDSVLRHVAIRQKAFGIVATTTVKRALANIVIQLMGYKLGSVSLLLGHASGQGVGIGSLAKLYFDGKQTKLVSITGMKAQARRYRRFPLYSVWEGLLNTLSAQLPMLLFAAIFSPVAAGLYSLANRVLSLPITLIGNAVSQVFLSEASNAYCEGRLGQLVTKLHAKLVNIGLPPAILLFLVGPELFGKIFGANWIEAGEFARWMVPWLYLVFVTSPLSSIPSVMERQSQGMAFQLILLVARGFSIWIGAIYFDLLTTVIIYSMVSAICWVGFLIWIKTILKINLCEFYRPLRTAALFGFICSFPSICENLLSLSNSLLWWICLLLSFKLIIIRNFLYLKPI